VVTILLTKVIPVFEKMFKDSGGERLPGQRRLVIEISHDLGARSSCRYIIAALFRHDGHSPDEEELPEDAQGAAGV